MSAGIFSKTVSSLLISLSGNFLDTVFPIRCLSCRKYDYWICDECVSGLTLKDEQQCPCCEINLSPGGKTCFSCRQNYPLSGILTCASYSNPLIANAVHYYKYRFVPDLHVPLGKIMSRMINTSPFPVPDLIVPVPLHSRRLRWRGFNQTTLLANQLAADITPGLKISVDEKIIHRTKWTAPQMKLRSYASRRKNIIDAFSIGKNSVAGKTILLVDDIATTASTLTECAKVLKNAGAKEVYAIVLARQEIKKRPD